MTKAQLLTQLAARCVDSTGIAYEFVGTEQYDSNNPNQTDGGAVVQKYRFYGLFPAGKLTARVRAVSFFVQDEGGANENALVEPDSLDGLFRGEVETYLDGVPAILDYQIEKLNTTAETATGKVAISDGQSGIQIVTKFIEKTGPGTFTNSDISAGSWNSAG